MEFLTFAKRFFRLLSLFLVLVFAAGVLGAVIHTFLIPRLSAWPPTSRLPWPVISSNGPTIIQRTEQIVLSQEEGLERFVAAPRTAVVSIVSVPAERSARVLPNGAARTMSGVLVTNDGMVAVYANEAPLTAGRRFTVFFSDGNASLAEYVAYDTTMNVAYFRTERADTPAISFANSNDIRQGRRFMALAATSDPEEAKLASGYIGEHNRTFNLSGKTVASADEWEGVFFADRAIGSEFSSGAAVAMNGDLIGLIGAITIDSAELSFILPANALRQSLQRVIGGQSTVRANVGAYYISLSKETALILGVARDRGAMIYTPSSQPGLAVISGSLAEDIGLRYGDVVVAVNGREINLEWPLSVALYEVATGERVTLSVERGGNTLELSFVR